MGDLLGRPQTSQQRDHLVGAPTALLDRYLHGAELLCVLTADADAEHHPAVGGAVEIGDLLGDDAGGYSGSSRIDVPTRTRSVSVARRARPIMASGLGLRDAM